MPSGSTPSGAVGVETDERMRAGEKLWAIGAIPPGKGRFTHVSDYQAEVALGRPR